MTWLRCAACGHVFTDGYYTEKALDLIYGQTHEHEKIGFDIENQRAISARIIEKILPHAPSGDWLDVGFGNGSLLFTAEEYGYVPVGIDLRAHNVDGLRAFGIEAGCVDIGRLNQPGRFSVISLADVLEHLPFPGEGLRAAHALLKSGGILFLSMPNIDSVLWKALDQHQANPYWGEIEHYHNFGRKRLFKLLHDSGFEPVRFGIGERYRVCMEVVARRRDGASSVSTLGLDTADALNARGYELQEQRRHEDALDCFDRALALQPDHVHALNNRGNALLDLKRHEEAMASFDRVLELDPDYAEAYNNRGVVLINLGRDEGALASLERAAALKPDYAQAHGNCAYVLHRMGRIEEALARFERVLELAPDDADALNNYGNVLLDLKQNSRALDAYERLLAMRPDHFDALNNRGCVLLNLKRFEEALASLDCAIALRPDNPITLNNRGYALALLRKYDQALASYERALALDPDYVDALNNRGNALLDLKRFAEALVQYEHALLLRPDHADALHNRGSALLELGRHAEAARSFARLAQVAPDHDYPAGKALDCRLRGCDWSDYAGAVAQIDEAVAKGERAAFPFFFLSVSGSAANQLRCARTYVADKYPASSAPLWMGQRYQHDKIRLAYLSGDFHEHPVPYLMVDLFESHDRERFETTAVSFGPESADEMRHRLKRAFHRFLDVRSKSDREVAQLLRELEIDIAVDLAAFTAEGRVGIMAHRPAPIQVNYLGYPGTMGADYIDYLIADRHVIPLADQVHYSERVVYLPDSYLSNSYRLNDSTRSIAQRTPSRAELGLPEAGFVFCCFNNNYKIAPYMFDIWMRLLRKVEGSVLWLRGGHVGTLDNLRREAESRGVAAERLIFAAWTNLDDYLARQRQADLFLDTLPYNAHTTACDALWEGLPVLTCMGTAFAGRAAGSLLEAIGLPELITHSLEEYEARALQFAAAPGRLAEIRAKLANNRATYPLFDTDRFRRHLESAYITMWERHQRGQAPESFSVTPMQSSAAGAAQ